LFNNIVQLCHGENKLHFDEMMMIMIAFVLDQYTELDFYSASSLKQQSVGRVHIILILSQPVFALIP